jgi:DNA polymerase/3'-5' exonuclease PolX
VFKKILALALVLVLVAICTRRPLDGKLSERLPNTCNAAQFREAAVAFEDLRFNQSMALERVEKMPIREPLDYALTLKRELATLRDLEGKASAVSEPRCLAHAKQLFIRYLEETQKALALRGADKDFNDYRRARESAENIHAQYAAEVKLQEKNRQ